MTHPRRKPRAAQRPNFHAGCGGEGQGQDDHGVSDAVEGAGVEGLGGDFGSCLCGGIWGFLLHATEQGSKKSLQLTRLERLKPRLIGLCFATLKRCATQKIDLTLCRAGRCGLVRSCRRRCRGRGRRWRPNSCEASGLGRNPGAIRRLCRLGARGPAGCSGLPGPRDFSCREAGWE